MSLIGSTAFRKKEEESYSDKQSESDCDDTKVHETFQKSNKRSSNTQRLGHKVQATSCKVKAFEQDISKRPKILKQAKKLKKFQDENLASDEDEASNQNELSDHQDQKIKGKVQNRRVKSNKKVQKAQEATNIQEHIQINLKGKKTGPGLINSQKRKSKNADKMNENEQKANQVIEQIDEAYQADVDLFKSKRTADKKLRCIIEIYPCLKQVEVAKAFHKLDGILLFIKWLIPNQYTQQQTSLTVKIKVLNLLLDLNLKRQNVEQADNLERVIKKYQKSKFESLRTVSSKIIDKWKLLKISPTK